MKTSTTGSFKSTVSKIMMGLALTAMIISMDVAPALGRHDRQDNRRYEQRRGRGPDRGHYVYERGRRVYRPYYGYRERVYVPPPVIYAPPPAPGISIWFPPIVIPLR